MTDYLIKSSTSLFVLLAVYHLFLEKEKMHTFNRFYLLLSIVFSFTIPFITIEVIKEIPQSSGKLQTLQPVLFSNGALPEEQANYIPLVILGLYLSVILLLAIRFIRNIVRIKNRIKTNTTLYYKQAKLVLLEQKGLPYTFLDAIFINKDDYNNRNIEAELYEHELTHVTQRHTLDVLFIETVKTIFWFNPIFIFYKRAIQLNHEFLADEKVVKSYNDVQFYQKLLLSKANGNQIVYLASNLNYSITKKRLLMMTKTTSASVTLLKQLALIPLFTALIFILCTKTIAQEIKKTDKPKPVTKTQIKTKSKPEPTVTQVKFAKPKQYANEIKENKSNPEHIYGQADEQPEYPGGISEFYKYIGKNFKVPEDLKESTRIITQFVIEMDGSISDIKILKDPGYGTVEEIKRILEKSEKWKPGKVNGKNVRVQYTLPISVVPQTATPEK